jgi:hypothetical protein
MIIIHGSQGTGKSFIAHSIAFGTSYSVVDLGEGGSRENIDEDTVVVCQFIRNLPDEIRAEAQHILSPEGGDTDD